MRYRINAHSASSINLRLIEDVPAQAVLLHTIMPHHTACLATLPTEGWKHKRKCGPTTSGARKAIHAVTIYSSTEDGRSKLREQATSSLIKESIPHGAPYHFSDITLVFL